MTGIEAPAILRTSSSALLEAELQAMTIAPHSKSTNSRVIRAA
jgi:hypothetical protein